MAAPALLNLTTIPEFHRRSAMKVSHAAALAALVLCMTAQAQAQVKIDKAWARPTVPGQQGGGGFMTMQSPVADKLLSGSTPAAERFELHTMAMEGDVMKMREVKAIELPAGQKVELKPGGLHVMFIGIKEPLKVGSKVPVTLKFEKAGEVKVEFDVTSRPMSPADMPAKTDKHDKHKHH
jgi:periplasmic copper chaperone A